MTAEDLQYNFIYKSTMPVYNGSHIYSVKKSFAIEYGYNFIAN